MSIFSNMFSEHLLRILICPALTLIKHYSMTLIQISHRQHFIYPAAYFRTGSFINASYRCKILAMMTHLVVSTIYSNLIYIYNTVICIHFNFLLDLPSLRRLNMGSQMYTQCMLMKVHPPHVSEYSIIRII